MERLYCPECGGPMITFHSENKLVCVDCDHKEDIHDDK